MTRLHAIYLDLKSGQCIWSSRRRHICKLHKNSRLNTYNAFVHIQCTGSRWYERWPRSKSSVGGELGGVRCGNREQFTPTPLTAAAACWPAGASSKPSPGISHWLDLDETSCLVLVTLSSNPGLSSRPASHWQAPQHRESRGRSSPPLLPPLLQPSRPRSASRSPQPEDVVDHWVRIFGTCEQSTLNHQSQMKYCWLNRVPLGQRKLYLTRLASPKLAQMWNAWHSASGSA